jgi:carbon monoxide dehydrogenase subunit G
VHTKVGGRVVDSADIEVVSADAPQTIVERNVSAGGKRVATGTYQLTERAGGGTHVSFEFAWEQAPLADRVAAPVVRAILRRGNQRAMQRLAHELNAR